MALVAYKNELFLLDNDYNYFGILGFSTKSNPDVLCGINTILIDGTIRSCPKYFH